MARRLAGLLLGLGATACASFSSVAFDPGVFPEPVGSDFPTGTPTHQALPSPTVGFTFVQQAMVALTSQQANVPIALPQATLGSDLILVLVSWGGTAATAGVVDDHGSTYALVGELFTPSKGHHLLFFYAAGPPGVRTVTVQNNPAVQTGAIVLEVGGVLPGPPGFEGWIGATGTSTTPASGRLAFASSGSLVFAGTTLDLAATSLSTAGGCAFLQAVQAGSETLEEYAVAAQTTSMAPSFVVTPSDGWAAMSLAFRHR